MKKVNGNRIVSSFILVFLMVSAALAQQRLVLVGGGERPPDAISKMVEWAGGEKSRILIVTWAGGDPQASFDAIKKDFFETGSKIICLHTGGLQGNISLPKGTLLF